MHTNKHAQRTTCNSISVRFFVSYINNTKCARAIVVGVQSVCAPPTLRKNASKSFVRASPSNGFPVLLRMQSGTPQLTKHYFGLILILYYCIFRCTYEQKGSTSNQIKHIAIMTRIAYTPMSTNMSFAFFGACRMRPPEEKQTKTAMRQ